MTESEILENQFQSPCNSADLLNNQSTPCIISCVNIKNKKLEKEIAKANQENNVMKSHLNNSNNQMLQMRKTIKILHQNAIKCKFKHPLYKQLLKSNRKRDYCTGTQTLKQFEKIYDIVSPFIQRRWRGKKKVINSNN